MQQSANFKVDPRLASLLGENYRSTELAIKELIDNAFDADAEQVWVELPRPFKNDPIVIRDDGTGMTEQELRHEYLNIASSRVSRKGERTRLKNRLVKGRKGIGKFAGLMVASLMEIKTQARGVETHLKIWRDELIRAKNDLEMVNLPISTTEVAETLHGTEIVLNGINQNFTFPNAEKLKRLLVLEYGRQEDFRIYVDGELVDIEDIPGDQFEFEMKLKKGNPIQVRYTISDGRKALKQSGMAIRVGGKVVGKPHFFGLDEETDIPQRLLKRVYGEVVADVLEKDVTADWGSIIENSIVLQEINRLIRPKLEASLMDVYQREIEWSRNRLQKNISRGLSALSPHRQKLASNIVDKVLRKFYGESESRISAILSLLLESFEQNEYWQVMQNIQNTQNGAVDDMAKVFSEFGMLDVAMIAQQSSHRLTLLNNLEQLIFNPETTLAQIHKALASNLWVLGNQYSLVSTNQELQQVVDMYVGRKFTNGHAAHAPNLLLLQDFNTRFLLIDLKSPDHRLEIADRRRAMEYQADLKIYLPQRDIDVLIIGGALSPGMVPQKASADIKFLSYKGMVSDARVQLNWLIAELEKR